MGMQKLITGLLIVIILGTISLFVYNKHQETQIKK